MYKYKAKITRVVDGDTADVMIDLGFSVTVNTTLRLYGINTPEMKGASKAEGAKSKARLKELVEGKDVVIESRVYDKYGRTVATVFLGDVNVNDLMVREGLAVPYMVDK